MRNEVQLGASYIVRLLNRHQKLDSEQVERFTQTLITILCDKFAGHWYPDSPQKGQAYRCIRIEHSLSVDDSVLQACVRSGLRCSQLSLPRDMSLWIDPQEVSCRLGESCRPFIVKAPEDVKVEKAGSVDKPELDTSDYHSEGSDRADTPSECSSEDEEADGGKKLLSTPVIDSKKMGAQFYYNPSPVSTVFYQYPNHAVSFIPTYQPLTMYYLIPKPSKFYQSNKYGGYHQKWKSSRTATKTAC
ncbi:protein BTG3 [Bombina bombina]|uniref:protein BTG3 n=1 Tax=Bombina bombina TaxID=8345 RepID=UPI00235A991C|nr:protein BTG3 [Bombina bombina]